jgi:N-acetylmuramoyl-L-alanine amidase
VDIAQVGAVTTTGATAVYQFPTQSSPVVSHLRAGINLPVTAHDGGFVEVLTPCEVAGWVRVDQVTLREHAHGPPQSFDQAIFVIDPGHGGMQTGAIGRGGLPEKDANLAIARKLVDQLAGAQVFLTRDADYTAGIRYRTLLANTLGAHALVSVHNNSIPDGPSGHPGTETWHQVQSTASLRLAQLVQGELVEALSSFKVSWVSDAKAGTRTRLNADGHDYYGILRGSRVPAVIVESMYIDNPPEEALLRTPQGQDAVAGALGRVLREYVSSPRPDIAVPYAGAAGTAGGVPAGCVDPA